MKPIYTLFLAAILATTSISKGEVLYITFDYSSDEIRVNEWYFVEASAVYINSSGAGANGQLMETFLNLYRNQVLVEWHSFSWYYNEEWMADAVGSYRQETTVGVVEYMAEAVDTFGGYDLGFHYVTVSDGTPSCSVEIENHKSGDTIVRQARQPATVTVRFKATDIDGDLAGIRPNILAPNGTLNNNDYEFIPQSGPDGVVEWTVTLNQNGIWYFWTDAQDSEQEATGEYSQSPAWYSGFCIFVEEGNLLWADRLNDRVTLVWDAAAGDGQGSFYDVYRDGDWIAEVQRQSDTNTYFFSETGIAGNAAVTYQIHARGTVFDSVTVRTCTIDMQSPPSWWNDVHLGIFAGNNQTARPGQFLEEPIIIQLTGADAVNFPVTFTIDQGGGSLHVDKNNPASSEITLISDAEGKVQLWYRQPPENMLQSRICASSAGKQVFFHTMSDSTYVPGSGSGNSGENLPEGFAAWALAHGLDPTRPYDDSDSDGVNNLNEFLMGTNPLDAGSIFHLVLETPGQSTHGVNTTTWEITPITSP